MLIAGPTNFNLITYVLPIELRSDEGNAMTSNLHNNSNNFLNLFSSVVGICISYYYVE